ncbi:hypothetical protein FHZ94_06975 [Listeria monocytogenes]|nr:hypothetical protein [Listeria monocytogenes]EBF5125228.1 hypothetical protein [Listeria monocytogenes]
MTELCLLEKIVSESKEVLFFVPSQKNTIVIPVSTELVAYFASQEAQKDTVYFYQIDLANKEVIMESDF